jgi:hypothetical protein
VLLSSQVLISVSNSFQLSNRANRTLAYQVGTNERTISLVLRHACSGSNVSCFACLQYSQPLRVTAYPYNIITGDVDPNGTGPRTAQTGVPCAHWRLLAGVLPDLYNASAIPVLMDDPRCAYCLRFVAPSLIVGCTCLQAGCCESQAQGELPRCCTADSPFVVTIWFCSQVYVATFNNFSFASGITSVRPDLS